MLKEASPSPQAAFTKRRFVLWLAFLAAVGLLVLALAKAFPEALRTRQDMSSVAYGVGLLVLMSLRLLRSDGFLTTKHLRYAALWTALSAVLTLGYAYRDIFSDLPLRLQMAFNLGQPLQTSAHKMVVPRDQQGAYVVIGQVNGRRVRFIVDTGATETVLSPDDARRLGVDLAGLTYADETETANGKGYGALYIAKSLEVGPIRLDDFKMSINKSDMSASLLGLSFLNQLASFEFQGDALVLRWRTETPSAQR